MKAVWLPIVAGIASLVVAGRELAYRRHHPFQHGVSGELIALALSAALIAATVAWLAYEWRKDEWRRQAHAEQLAAEYFARLSQNAETPTSPDVG